MGSWSCGQRYRGVLEERLARLARFAHVSGIINHVAFTLGQSWVPACLWTYPYMYMRTLNGTGRPHFAKFAVLPPNSESFLAERCASCTKTVDFGGRPLSDVARSKADTFLSSFFLFLSFLRFFFLVSTSLCGRN